MSTQPTLEDLISLAKRRGFVYPTSAIYGGLANSYDYGPLGAELLRNIRNAWWKFFIHNRPDMVGLDTQIMLHPQTWVASGHVNAFHDPLVEDKVTHKRYRADHIIEHWLDEHRDSVDKEMYAFFDPEISVVAKYRDIDTSLVANLTLDAMGEFIHKYNVQSPEGNPITDPKTFNLLFETEIGSVADEKNQVYLRGETAQGIFTNFKQILDSTRVQLPFGVGNIGKSFRNEITTGQFVFRTIEFEQAEIEYFFNPKTTDWKQLMDDWKSAMWTFVTEVLGVRAENLRWRQHTDKERSHYSLDTYDLEYNFPFGWKELWGVAYRTDYDLTQHQKMSGQSLEYTDPQTGERFIPHVIEPAVGVNRLFLMLMNEAYRPDTEKERLVMAFKPKIAPYQAAVFPLLKNKPELVAKAKEVYQKLLPEIHVAWDERGNIGKRYLSQDEMGTPYCITVDFQTLEDDTVTIRNRDTAQQERMKVTEILKLALALK